MSNNELITTKAQRAMSAKTLDITNARKFAQAAQMAGELQKQIDAFWAAVGDQMTDRKIKKIEGDWGYATIAQRKNWKVDSTVPPRFFKQVADTKKLAAALDEGKLPTGASFTVSEYLTKRVK